jgi:hypothetical protein
LEGEKFVTAPRVAMGLPVLGLAVFLGYCIYLGFTIHRRDEKAKARPEAWGALAVALLTISPMRPAV